VHFNDILRFYMQHNFFSDFLTLIGFLL